MRAIFNDSALQQEFDEMGYVIIPLLSESDVEALLDIYTEYFPETPSAFFSSSYLSDLTLKKKISEKAGNIIQPKLGRYFNHYRSIGSAFLTKSPGQRSELPMHQDWTIVDESQHIAINIWTPLTEMTMENGTLEVLPGSNNSFRTLRAPSLPFSGSNHTELLKKHLQPIHAQPGDAVILDQALIHYSGPNNSTQPRLAMTSGIVSESAPLSLHYWDKENETLEQYLQKDDFLLRFDNFHQDIFQRPTGGELKKSIPYQPVLYTEEEIKNRLPETKAKEEKPISWVTRLLSRLKG